jgi:hypothetical protein
MMLTFDMVFLPLFIVAMAAAGIVTGRKRRARLLQERARNDQQRFAWDFFANAPDRKSSALFL